MDNAKWTSRTFVMTATSLGLSFAAATGMVFAGKMDAGTWAMFVGGLVSVVMTLWNRKDLVEKGFTPPSMWGKQ